MFHAECKPRCHKSQRAWATEPCSKKMKSTDEPYGKSYDGLQNLYEEIHVKKSHSGFIPLSLSEEEEEDGKEAQQENGIAEVLDPSKQEFSGKEIVSSEPSDSVCNAEVIGNSPVLTNNADVVGMRDNSTSIRKHRNEGETEVYSTSKAFIGPIYKGEADCQPYGRKKALSSNSPEVLAGRHTKKKMMPKQAVPCDVSKIEDELSQFYSEINQLEYDDHSTDFPLQETEADSHSHLVEYNKLNHIVCVSPQDWSHSRTSVGGGGQCFYNKSSDQRTHSEQYLYSDPKGPRLDNSQCFDNGRKVWEGERLHNKQAGSRFWNDCVPQFKSGWSQTHPFIIPYGPPTSQFTPHFDFQKLNSPSHHSDAFYPSNVGPFENTRINMSTTVTDQKHEYASHFGTPSRETTRNVYNVPDGQMDIGFCETKACWKDLKTSSTVSCLFPNSNLCESQKFLIILRGLPGSGKTTLSRILLGQSRDGIAFSTDDYFRQQDGYWSYNVGQLGAAHEWNQKRAKQAMDQGRSPIIIDNTNTQAWEMKPYVEAALENGYKVEFHEPNTWWKFDSEELEKRNEHGVSREKITQMLERYDYPISIPIVMNSVVPFYKTSQRPQRRQRETVIKKRHRLRKMKQRRILKRNREMKSAAIKEVENKSHDDFTPSDENLSQSEGEDSEVDGTAAFVTGHLNEPKEGREFGSASDNRLKDELQKGSLISEMVDIPALDSSLNIDVLSGDSRCSLSLLSIPNENITEQSCSDHLSVGIASNIFMKNKNNIWTHSNQNSALKLEYNSKETFTVFPNMEGKATFARPFSESGAENKLLGNEKEGTISCEHETSKNERNARTFSSFELADKQACTSFEKHESWLAWPEVIYDQRSKKLWRPKKVFSERTTESTDYKSDKEPKRDSDTDLVYAHNAVPLMLTDSIHKMSCSEIDDFSTESVAKATGPSDVNMHLGDTSMHPSRKKERCKRTFKLAPQFDIPRQIAVGIDKKLLQDVILFIEQEDSKKEKTLKKNKQALGYHGCPGPSGYDASPLDIKPFLSNDSKQLAEESTDLSNNVPASPIQINTSASCNAPLSTEGQTVTVDKTNQLNKMEKWGKISLDVPTIQPDILHSVNVIAECLADSAAENIEQMQQINETKTKKYSQTDGGQDSPNTKSSFLKLPLSLGFALQLVELFGSPGVPLDTLLPHDYVVPLDWATSKEIHLQWKTSVELVQLP
ncbi:uncharacterized protein [Tiliqua scincoides]|uniref:uncharacterized protein isoform X2 n=1 Tax=Tiliqua scincoides TaxID=71010 RepID=UPI003462C1C5